MTAPILLVEDNVVLGTVLEEVLRRSGHEVILVGTLKDEVERVRTHPVSAVILDLDIDMTSVEKELTRLTLLGSYCKFLPIVLMGVQVPQELPHGLRSPFGGQQAKHIAWLQKPFRNEELLAAVQQAQGRSSSQPTLRM
ncbi:MAG: response regulator [Nitrospiraceae bacterium]